MVWCWRGVTSEFYSIPIQHKVTNTALLLMISKAVLRNAGKKDAINAELEM